MPVWNILLATNLYEWHENVLMKQLFLTNAIGLDGWNSDDKIKFGIWDTSPTLHYCCYFNNECVWWKGLLSQCKSCDEHRSCSNEWGHSGKLASQSSAFPEGLVERRKVRVWSLGWWMDMWHIRPSCRRLEFTLHQSSIPIFALTMTFP